MHISWNSLFCAQNSSKLYIGIFSYQIIRFKNYIPVVKLLVWNLASSFEKASSNCLIFVSNSLYALFLASHSNNVLWTCTPFSIRICIDPMGNRPYIHCDDEKKILEPNWLQLFSFWAAELKEKHFALWAVNSVMIANWNAKSQWQ